MNSLALCDWSDLQKTRRSVARHYCFPSAASSNYQGLSDIAVCESKVLLQMISDKCRLQRTMGAATVNIKKVLLLSCANVFMQYMCSTRFDPDHSEFLSFIDKLDLIFWDINQGYAVDFLPWLAPAYRRHMKRLSTWSQEIRSFIMEHIIVPHQQQLDPTAPRDFTDSLLAHVDRTQQGANSASAAAAAAAGGQPHQPVGMDLSQTLFELEDFLGGHSAIGNMLLRALAEVSRADGGVVERIREEVDRVTDGGRRDLNLFDRSEMPYTEATLLETLRIASSPIVPHVASRDTSIAGYSVAKDTVVFLNNYELNTGEHYWSEPTKFDPSRFVVDGKLVKPKYFMPFSTGKRACMGYKMVQSISFIFLATIFNHFDLKMVSTQQSADDELPKACVALHPNGIEFVITPRQLHTTQQQQQQR